MPPEFAHALTTGVTARHLESYVAATRGDHERAIEIFGWNLSVAGAFMEDLATTEILLRWAIDAALREHFQPESDSKPWYEQNLLRYTDYKLIDEAIRRATESDDWAPYQDEVVEAMSFGVWAMLLDDYYERTLWPALRGAFKYLGPGQQLKLVYVADPVRDLADLRNDIAHHKAIFDWNLVRNFEHIKRVSGLIDPRIHRWLCDRSRISDVLAADPRKLWVVT